VVKILRSGDKNPRNLCNLRREKTEGQGHDLNDVEVQGQPQNRRFCRFGNPQYRQFVVLIEK
jgi:hypothetical protein